MVGNKLGVVKQPLVGYRHWSFREGQVRSPYVAEVVWAGPRMRATCVEGYGVRPHGVRGAIVRATHGRAPDRRCRCGLYAWNELSLGGWAIAGMVVGWGLTMLHRTGFRSEHMKAIGFCAPEKQDSDLVAVIAKAWEVPVLEVDQLREFSREFGALATEVFPRVCDGT